MDSPQEHLERAARCANAAHQAILTRDHDTATVWTDIGALEHDIAVTLRSFGVPLTEALPPVNGDMEAVGNVVPLSSR